MVLFDIFASLIDFYRASKVLLNVLKREASSKSGSESQQLALVALLELGKQAGCRLVKQKLQHDQTLPCFEAQCHLLLYDR